MSARTNSVLGTTKINPEFVSGKIEGKAANNDLTVATKTLERCRSMVLFILAIPLLVMLFMLFFGFPAMLMMEGLAGGSPGAVFGALAWIAVSLVLISAMMGH